MSMVASELDSKRDSVLIFIGPLLIRITRPRPRYSKSRSSFSRGSSNFTPKNKFLAIYEKNTSKLYAYPITIVSHHQFKVQRVFTIVKSGVYVEAYY